MENVDLMEALQSFEALNRNVPDAGLLNQFLNWLVLLNVLTEITAFKEFSDQTERAGNFIVKGVHVGNDVRVIDGGKDSDFIETVGNFLFREWLNFDSFEGVEFGVDSSLDFVDRCKGTLAEFADDFVLVHGNECEIRKNSWNKFVDFD